MRAQLALALLWFTACTTARAPLPAPRAPLVATPPRADAAPVAGASLGELPALPRVELATLPNGVRVYVLSRHAFPHVGIAYVNTRGGENPADLEQAGLASLLVEGLLDAAARREEQTLVTTGAALRDVSYLGGVVLREEAERMTLALAKAVRHPDFSEEAVQRAQRRARRDWAAERYAAPGVAHNHLMQRLYGPAHVLGQHADMAVKRVDAHTAKELAEGYRARYVPAASVLVFVGDVTRDEAVRWAEHALGDFQGEAPAPATFAPSDWQPRGLRKVFLHSGSSEATLALGQRAPGATDPAFPALELATQVLGGSYGSRLMDSLRTEHQLTYFVRAWLEPRREGSTLFVETVTPDGDAERALELMLAELERLRATSVTDAELESARQSLLQAELARYETTSGALTALVSALNLGRDPATDLPRRAAALAQVNAATLLQVAQAVLTPRTAPVIVVGNLELSTALDRWRRHDDEKL